MNGAKIQVRNVGTLPPRTSVSFETESDFDVSFIDVAAVPKTYACIDCGWTTKVAEHMNQHQRDHWRYHTFRQRFMRSMDLIYGWMFIRRKPVTVRTTVTPVLAE